MAGGARGKTQWETWGQSGDIWRDRFSRECKGTQGDVVTQV